MKIKCCIMQTVSIVDTNIGFQDTKQKALPLQKVFQEGLIWWYYNVRGQEEDFGLWIKSIYNGGERLETPWAWFGCMTSFCCC